MIILREIPLAVIVLCLAGGTTLHAHSHISSGVDERGQLALFDSSGDPLPSLNPTLYHLLWTPEGGRYGGYYALNELPRIQHTLDYFTFTAQSDGQAEDPGPNHAPTGAEIWMEISSISGPEGATFGFWEAGWSIHHHLPTQTFVSDGSPNGFRFILSEPLSGFPQETQDPFGHIHYRGYTVDRPGSYLVTFTLYDLSGLGENGTGLALPSHAYTFQFVALPIPEPSLLGFLGISAIGAFLFVITKTQRGRLEPLSIAASGKGSARASCPHQAASCRQLRWSAGGKRHPAGCRTQRA